MGEKMNEHYYKYIILLLFTGGLVGWILFGLMVRYLIAVRLSQVTMLSDIKVDLAYLKSEIRQMK